ncbi:hypothetical protein L1987_15065 [Smallanthus sonchifolius]|uniref:Uncharacterized protein n=1 Tax=Smallanthus sonchifolius TaxID=185202 RepID=A0ACB9J633_9ASTR|nr:hypothetical protein L1987_15065 [Smallanthus sonchifolius]
MGMWKLLAWCDFMDVCYEQCFLLVEGDAYCQEYLNVKFHPVFIHEFTDSEKSGGARINQMFSVARRNACFYICK